jgi:hypothetical protein
VAIIFTPGQVVAGPDWEALFGQHGGSKSQQIRPPTKEEQRAIEDAGGDVDQNPIYRYYAEDGSYVEARTAPNGDYQIVSYTPSERFKQAETKRAAADPAQQTPAQQNDAALNAQRAKNAALPPEQDPRYETDQERATRADATIKAQGAAADAQRKEAETAAERNKPQVAAGTLNTTSPNIGVVDPATGNITWKPNPNYQSPSPQPITIPGNPKTITWDDGPGKPLRTEKNPAYVKPSKIMPHPSDPTKMVNVTEDDNGNPVILPVDDKTTIKPADLPVLQAKYGQIAQGLGALAQDLNSRYARGEITEAQKNTAFTAAHQQAQTQVSEINQILDTSKAIWSGELTQRGQSLSETQSRRGFAQNIFDRAAATGMGIATSAGPGHGKDIAAGVGALMNMGQRYAEGMGGFRESPEIALPAALQQARGMGIPGFGDTGGPPGPPGAAPGLSGAPTPAGMSPPPAGFPPGTGVSNTTDAGGVPRLMTPASATGPVAAPPGAGPQAPAAGHGDPGFYPPGMQGPNTTDPRFYPPGMQGPSTVDPGFHPPGLQGMGQALQSGLGFGGSPVAAGGGGMYDPSQDIQGMIGDGADPTWAEAVRRAAAEVNQPGYGWDRFTQPASRFG